MKYVWEDSKDSMEAQDELDIVDEVVEAELDIVLEAGPIT